MRKGLLLPGSRLFPATTRPVATGPQTCELTNASFDEPATTARPTSAEKPPPLAEFTAAIYFHTR